MTDLRRDAPRNARAYSTQSQLFVMAAILVAPIACVAIYLAAALYRSEKTLFEQSARDAARNTTTAIEREVTSIARTLDILASSEALRRGDLATFRRQADEAARVEQLVFTYRDLDSRQLMNTDVPAGAPLPDRSNLAAADQRAAQSGRHAVSDYYVGLSNSRPSFAVVVQISIDGAPRGFLSASSSMTRLRNILVEENGRTWRAALVDRNGVVITRAREPDVSGARAADAFWTTARSTRDGLWEGVSSEGEKSLTAYQKTSFDWTVVVGAPVDGLESELRQLTILLTAGLTGLIALALASALLIARRISGPVVALEKLSIGLSRGEAVTSLATGNREANRVGEHLEASSVTLRGRAAALAQSQARYRSLFESIDEGFCIIRMIRDAEGRATDYRFIETNAGFELHAGMKDVVGRTALELQPDLAPWWIAFYDGVARTGEGRRIERNASEFGRWFDVHATCISIEEAEVAVLFEDITARRREQERLTISEARFRAVQETSVDGFMVLESVRENGVIVDFTWIYVNDAGARIVGRPKDSFPGRRLLETMPGNRDDGLFDAYVRVVETGEHWTKEFTYRHEGLDIYIRLVAAKADDGFAVTFADLSGRRRAEEAARESEARLAAALRAGQLGVHEYFVESGHIEWDSTARRLWGVSAEEPITYDIFERGVHPDDLDAVRTAVAAAFDPAGDGHYLAEYRVIDRTTGQTRWVVAEGMATIVGGKPSRLLGTVRDVTARKKAEEQRTLLVNELNHRVKNTLATVQSLASQSFRDAPPETKAMLRQYEARLFALARAHNILTRESWNGADLQEILRDTLAAHLQALANSRVTISGPAVRLSAQQGVSMAMAAHELATNAVKYGALSVETGRIAMSWTFDDGMLAFAWRESGGPPVVAPARSGFGTRLLTRGLARELDGKIELCFESSGVICRITFPVRG